MPSYLVEHACANPLCRHFRFMVQAGEPQFTRPIPQKLPDPDVFPVEELASSVSVEAAVERSGRQRYVWKVSREDLESTHRWCSVREATHNFMCDLMEYRETYYFCDSCDAAIRLGSPS